MTPDGLLCGEYEPKWVGIDDTNGRFGAVEMRQCHNCHCLGYITL
jgi:hypothetical protein